MNSAGVSSVAMPVGMHSASSAMMSSVAVSRATAATTTSSNPASPPPAPHSLVRVEMAKLAHERSFGMTLQQRASMDSFGYPHVSYVFPNSPASRAGIQVGWFIHSINNNSCRGRQVRSVAGLFRGATQVRMAMGNGTAMHASWEEDRGGIDDDNTISTVVRSPLPRREDVLVRKDHPVKNLVRSIHVIRFMGWEFVFGTTQVAIQVRPTNSAGTTPQTEAPLLQATGAHAAGMATGRAFATALSTAAEASSVGTTATGAATDTATDTVATTAATTASSSPSVESSTEIALDSSVGGSAVSSTALEPTTRKVEPDATPAKDEPLREVMSIAEMLRTAADKTVPPSQSIQQDNASDPFSQVLCPSGNENAMATTTKATMASTADPATLSIVAPTAAVPSEPAVSTAPTPTSMQNRTPPRKHRKTSSPGSSGNKTSPPQKQLDALYLRHTATSSPRATYTAVSSAVASAIAAAEVTAAAVATAVAPTVSASSTTCSAAANGMTTPVATPTSTTRPEGVSSGKKRARVPTRGETISPTRVPPPTATAPAGTVTAQAKRPRARSNSSETAQALLYDDVSDASSMSSHTRSPPRKTKSARQRRRAAARQNSEAITSRRPRRSLTVERLMTMGFTADDAQASVEACGHDPDACMVWIVSHLEEKQFLNDLNQASIQSELSKQDEVKELQKQESETLRHATALTTLFPTSFLLSEDAVAPQLKSILSTSMGAIDSDSLMRSLLTKLLKLEAKAIRWYKQAARAYMLELAVRLETQINGHDLLSCCNVLRIGDAIPVHGCKFLQALGEEEKALARVLFEMPENHGGVPVAFLHADESMQFSLEDDGFEVVETSA